MKRILFCSAAILLIALTSCKKATKDFVPDCSGAAKLFSADVLPVIQSSCVSCHSGYSNYSGICSSKSSIRSKVVDGSMPQKSSLSDAQKNAIICWIDNGTPNN
jgi:hypothetical protein